jgi:hypothetical protein
VTDYIEDKSLRRKEDQKDKKKETRK